MILGLSLVKKISEYHMIASFKEINTKEKSQRKMTPTELVVGFFNIDGFDELTGQKDNVISNGINMLANRNAKKTKINKPQWS